MQTAIIQPRMKNPVMVVPDALQPLLDLGKAAREAGLPPKTAELVHLRAAQINGCSYCTEMHSRELRNAGETDERISRWPPGGKRRTSQTRSVPRWR